MDIYTKEKALIKASLSYSNEINSRFFHDEIAFNQLCYNPLCKLLNVKSSDYFILDLLHKN